MLLLMAPLLDFFPVARYTFILLLLMVSVRFFPYHTMHRSSILLSLLASLLDFFSSHNTPLSHYVISVGVSVGFFPVKRFTFIYLCYHCWCRCLIFSLSNDSPLSYIGYHCWCHCWIFSCQTIQLYLITLSLLDLFHSDTTFPLKPRHTPDIFFSKVENTRSPVPWEVDDGVIGGRQAGWPSPDVDEALAVGQAADERPLSRLLQRQQASWGGDCQGLWARLLLGL